MNKMFLATMVLVAGSYAFAAGDPAPPTPSLVGTWSLSALECSSGAPLTGGIRIGQDTMKATFAADQSATFNSSVGGCTMTSKGTYQLNGSILTTVVTESQSCKDANPVPMNETQKVYLAHLGAQSAVTVVTGREAAMLCPAGDALINHYMKDVVVP